MRHVETIAMKLFAGEETNMSEEDKAELGKKQMRRAALRAGAHL